MGYISRFDSAPPPPGPDPDEVVLWLGPAAINAAVPVLPEFEEEPAINADVPVLPDASHRPPDTLQTS